MKAKDMPFHTRLQKLALSDNQYISSLAQKLLALILLRRTILIDEDHRVDAAEALVHRLDERKRIMIFSERIEQATELYSRLIKYYPERVGLYHSEIDSTRRNAVLSSFRRKSIRILISCRSLDEGIDIPDAD